MSTIDRAAAAEFQIRFRAGDKGYEQDEESFTFMHEGEQRELRIHDYDELYKVPGLYEALVYDKLQCKSPPRLARLIAAVLPDWDVKPSDLRVLDLGAGNGIMAEELRSIGIDHVVGLDLLPEAAMAARRDRPDVYDDYIVADLTALTPDDEKRLHGAKLNCLVTAAALGFGDIPPEAFAEAFNAIEDGGWIAMTIKEDFLNPKSDDSGFAQLLRACINDQTIDIQSHHRYCHRLSISGEQLFYVGLVARKTADISESPAAEVVTRNGASHGSVSALLSRP